MTASYKIALTAAMSFSAVSLYDAVYHGITGRSSAISDAYGFTWVTLAAAILSAVAYIALGAILVIERVRIDSGSRVRHWVRRLMVVDLVVLAAVFGIGIPLMSTFEDRGLAAAVGAVAGVGFAAMFLLAVGLGLALLRVPELRPSAVLLIAVLPAIGLAIVLQAIGSGFAHPAYAETTIYLGIALLGRHPKPAMAEPCPSRADGSHVNQRAK